MIAIDFYKDRPVGVLGLGRTGCAVIEALVAGGADVIAWDDAKASRQKKNFGKRFKLCAPDHSDWCGIDLLVASPGISERHDLIERLRLLKIPITGDVELFGRALLRLSPRLRPKVIAITGTNGKSTVTKLVAHILCMAGFDVEMGGNIGVPVLALAPFAKERIYILEVSSYQAYHVEKFSPDVAVQLNITPDHTERHGSLENYAAAKARLFSRLGKDGIAIIFVKDEFGRKLAQDLKSRVKVVRLPDDAPAKMPDQNIMAAWAVAQTMNVGADLFQAALKSFDPLPHRMEEAAKIGAVRFINDSKATNAAAARRALAGRKNVYWLAGGAAKVEGFKALRGVLSGVRHAYLFGAARDELGDFLGEQVAWTKYKTLREAVHQAGQDAQKAGQKADQKIILLSPACASFDEFTDFAARGAAFGGYVREQSGKGVMFIAAGGSGGGLFPAESLARELRHRGFQCVLMTDRRALPLVDRALWDGVHHIFSAPLAGRAPSAWLGAAFWIGLGVLRSLWILAFKGERKGVIGFGGYASLPPLLAAILLRQPILLHEPGASLGRANRWLMRFARGAASSFPLKDSFDGKVPPLTAPPLILTGNPVRPDIIHLTRWPYQLPDKDRPFRLTVFAGSQGAQVFDKIVPQALALVASTGRKLHITQQFREDGQQSRDKIISLYQKAGIKADLAPFFKDLPRHIVQAHLVIARAGASTMSELAVLGRPAIIVPITGAVAHEQLANARSFEVSGAAWVIAEADLTAETLARRIEALMDDPVALTQAAKAAHHQAEAMGTLDAAAKLADFVETSLYSGLSKEVFNERARN